MVTTRRPPAVATFAAMFLGGSILGFLGVAVPLSERTPVALDAACSTAALIIAVTVWALAGRLPEWVLKAGVTLGSAMVGLVVSRSATPQGIMLIGFTYLWIAIYVAVFFSRRTVLIVAALVGVSFGAAILVNG